ncbi:Transmembrane osmosensor [Marasmius tenuissimus]|nr:Transmembrane osmosensor [Marasmius tenuissimus]
MACTALHEPSSNTCWDARPSLRPTADHALGKIAEMTSKGPSSPAPDWSGSLSTEVWENVEYRFRSPPPPGEAGTPITQPEVSPAPVAPPAIETMIFKAEALYTYTSEDPDDLCFLVGVALDILKAETLWWRARAPDGNIGMVPANYMRILGEVPVDYARALDDYSAPPEDPSKFSFAKDDILDALNRNGGEWLVRKADGTIGVVPSSLLVLPFGDLDPSTVLERLLSPTRRRRQFPSFHEIPSELQFGSISPPTNRPQSDTSSVVANVTDTVIFQAETLRSVTHADPSFLSFTKGVIMDILDIDDFWWRARVPDGTIGTVESIGMRILEKAPVDYARALYDYSASPEDPDEFSFAKDDILDVLNKNGDQWDVQGGGKNGISSPR